MTPRIRFWTGWDVLGVFCLLVGVVAFALIPTAIISFPEARFQLVTLLLCAGLFFLLAAYGRRLRHITHLQQEHPRPFDAPD